MSRGKILGGQSIGSGFHGGNGPAILYDKGILEVLAGQKLCAFPSGVLMLAGCEDWSATYADHSFIPFYNGKIHYVVIIYREVGVFQSVNLPHARTHKGQLILHEQIQVSYAGINFWRNIIFINKVIQKLHARKGVRIRQA